MNEEEQNATRTFMDVIDDDLRNSILRLNQKLKGLKAEIEAKLEYVEGLADENSKEQKERLLILGSEIDSAIQGLQELVTMTVEDDVTKEDFIEINREALEEYRQKIKNHSNTVTTISEQL